MKKRQLGLWALALVGATILSGCNLQSHPSVLKQAIIARKIDPQGVQQVLHAIAKMNALKTYEVKAQIQEVAGRFSRQVNFYGTVRLPNAVYVDETIGGNDYLVYQNNKFSYYRDNGHWYPMQPVTDLQPWQSMHTLLVNNPPQVVYSLPEQTVTSWLCNVYQFTTAAQPSVMGTFVQHGLKSGKIPQQALYTVWVDTTDGALRQIEVQSTVGVPQLGTASIDATQLYFGFDQTAALPVPQDLLSQVEKP